MNSERVRELFDYSPETGVMSWRERKQGRPVGRAAGSLTSKGYRYVAIDGATYFVHRLAWLHATGEWPRFTIDHINGDRQDNRIANLRDVTQQVNCQNRRQALGEAGLVGVSKSRSRWAATIKTNGVRKYLGSYATPAEAHAAYLKAKRDIHPGAYT